MSSLELSAWELRPKPVNVDLGPYHRTLLTCGQKGHIDQFGHPYQRNLFCDNKAFSTFWKLTTFLISQTGISLKPHNLATVNVLLIYLLHHSLCQSKVHLFMPTGLNMWHHVQL